jgi:hypothetical protein
MGKKTMIRWFDESEEHDYPAAAAYLSLLYEPEKVKRIVTALKKAPMGSYKAKDIFRASLLPLLGAGNFHVRKNLRKIEEGESTSPLLLVRSGDGGKVVIADGYHRMCSVYILDEDASIPCKIVGIDPASPKRNPG